MAPSLSACLHRGGTSALWSPPLDSLHQAHVLIMLVCPELDSVFQARSQKGRVEGKNHLPKPTCHVSSDVVQDTVGCLGCKCTLLSIKQPEKYFSNWKMANHVHLPKTVRRKIHRTTRLVNLLATYLHPYITYRASHPQKAFHDSSLTWIGKYGFTKRKYCLTNLSLMKQLDVREQAK